MYKVPLQFDRCPAFIGKDKLVTLDGVNFYDKTSEQGHKILRKAFVKIDYAVRDDEKETKALYEQFTKYAKELYDATDKKIDMMKTGPVPNTALHYFFHRPAVKELDKEEVTNDEHELMENTSKSDIIYAKEYKGKLFKYDFKSLYPSLMMKNKFPIKAGKWVSMKELPEELPYGFYLCKVKTSHWSFKKQKENDWITHIDINNLRELKKKVKLTTFDDDKPNAYIYDEDALFDGSIVFKDFIDLFYKLKEDGIFFAKPILNSLWGALCQRDSYKELNLNIKDFDEYNDDWFVHNILYSGDGKTVKVTKIRKEGKLYKYAFARMKPFIKSMSCATVRSRIWNQIDDVVRVYIDGFMMKTYLKGTFKAKTPFGGLKYEGMVEDGYVKNASERTEDKYFSFPGSKEKKENKPKKESRWIQCPCGKWILKERGYIKCFTCNKNKI